MSDKDLFKDLLDLEEDFDEDDNEDENLEEEEEKAKESKDEEGSAGESEEEKRRKEEEQRRKNKNAEEARKRREREAKQKKDEAKINEIGRQIEECKKKYPNLDIVALDKDENFKKFIDGKLLGKKDFTELYEDYIKLRGSLSAKSEEEVMQDYQLKSRASGGTYIAGGSGGGGRPADIYSPEELARLEERIPFMSASEYDRIADKLEKSLAFYEKKR